MTGGGFYWSVLGWSADTAAVRVLTVSGSASPG